MIGHKWAPAEGTIINSHSEQMEVPGHGMHYVAVYEMNVRSADGTAGRARVPSYEHQSLRPGMIVRLEISSKSGEIRLHPHRDKLILGYSTSHLEDDDDFAPSAAGPTTTTTVTIGSMSAAGTGLADLAQVFGGNLPPGAHVQVMGGADAAEIMRTAMSGSPADREAAKEQLRQLARGQTGGQPAAQQQTPADRLTALQQLADRGLLSQAEFDAKRQQILDEL